MAKNGLGSTAPNPMVGCVIVRSNEIIGEGYTSPYGGNHAEVNAIHSVENKDLLTDSTLYVSLEPCAHYGKTPPCTDLIVNSNIPKVFIGCQDPFSEVNGAGIKRLKQAGIHVVVGILNAECRFLNRRFFTCHEKKRPYIILKWAETADGSVDQFRDSSQTPSLKITSEASNILVHKWRSEEQSILIGKGTAIKDNPGLTTRKYEGKNPVRVLLDSSLSVPESSQIFNAEAETVVFNCKKSEASEKLEYVLIDDTGNLEAILTELFKRDIQSVLVEGGPTVQKSFYKAGLWDEVRRFRSSNRIIKGLPALEIAERPYAVEEVGSDKLYTYYNR